MDPFEAEQCERDENELLGRRHRARGQLVGCNGCKVAGVLVETGGVNFSCIRMWLNATCGRCGKKKWADRTRDYRLAESCGWS